MSRVGWLTSAILGGVLLASVPASAAVASTMGGTAPSNPTVVCHVPPATGHPYIGDPGQGAGPAQICNFSFEQLFGTNGDRRDGVVIIPVTQTGLAYDYSVVPFTPKHQTFPRTLIKTTGVQTVRCYIVGGKPQLALPLHGNPAPRTCHEAIYQYWPQLTNGTEIVLNYGHRVANEKIIKVHLVTPIVRGSPVPWAA